MPEGSTVSCFVPKAQTGAFAVIYLTVLAKLITTETKVSILKASVTESCQFTLADTPLGCHLILGKLFGKVASRLPVLEAS